MTSPHTTPSLGDRCYASLRRSRERRELARRARRRRIRRRGGGGAIAMAALVMGVIGAGAAVGHGVQPSPPTSAAPLLSQGSSGPAVTTVQNALGIPADGVFDAQVSAAVRDFQRRKGLLVDGIVGPQTRAALGLASPATAGGSAAPAQGSTAAPGGLDRIAQCESGGNPRAVGGGGRYRGKYQFSVETWRSVGGSGDPAAAPEAEQDRRAAMLYARGGSSHWPNCG